jgi:predicted exporter
MCTRWLLPPLLTPNSTESGGDKFSWLPAVRAGMGRLRALVLLVTLGAAVLIGLRHDSVWQDNLDSLSPSSAVETARDQAYRNDVGVPDLRTMVTVLGANLEEALQRTEAMTRVLETLVTEKALGSYDSPSDLLPSAALQKARQASLPAPDVLRPRIAMATKAGKLKPEAFEPFIADVEASRAMPPIDLKYYSGTLIGAWLATQIITTPDGVAVLVLLRGAASISNVRQRLASADLPGVSMIDLKGDVERLVSEYRQRAMAASLLGTAVIFLALMLQLRRARAVLSMVATLVSTLVLTVGLLLLIQGQLTIFNLVALLLVVGVVSNYTLFFSMLSPKPQARQRESVSVLLAAGSTFIGFSTLAFSSTPVLAMIGLTVSIGAVTGLLISMVFAAERTDLIN